MTCPTCAAALRPSPTGAGALCGACDRVFTLGGDGPVESLPPVGVDPLWHAVSVGFERPVVRAAAPRASAARAPTVQTEVVSANLGRVLLMRAAGALASCLFTSVILAVVFVVALGGIAFAVFTR